MVLVDPYGDFNGLLWFLLVLLTILRQRLAPNNATMEASFQVTDSAFVASSHLHIFTYLQPKYRSFESKNVRCQALVLKRLRPNCENWQTVVTIDWMYPRDDSRWALSDTVTGKYIASENVPLGWLLQDQSRWLFPKTVFQNLDMFWNDQLYKFGVLETQWQFRVASPTPETNEIPFKSEFYHIREKYDMNIKQTTWKNISVLKQQKQSLTGSKFFFNKMPRRCLPVAEGFRGQNFCISPTPPT